MQHETVLSILDMLRLPATHTHPSLEAMARTDSRALRDLKLNVSGVLASAHLSKQDAVLLALSVAVNEKNHALAQGFEQLARELDVSDVIISETHACVMVMSTNNVFYRFRHYMEEKEYYNKQPAGLRMSVMMNPQMGKRLFEMMSLVISAVNNCERCITSHEESVLQHGATEQQIYDAIRLASVIRSLCIVV